jgi:hypothetical protein
MTTRDSIASRGRSQDCIARERNILGDERFQLAMMRARRHCRERFTVGVDTRPCTDFPRYVPHQPLPIKQSNAINDA